MDDKILFESLDFIKDKRLKIMNDNQIKGNPPVYKKNIDEFPFDGFSIPSVLKTCCLLRMLAMAKPNGFLLELRSGTVSSRLRILGGKDDYSNLIKK